MIGTSSLRRAAQLKKKFPHLEFRDIVSFPGKPWELGKAANRKVQFCVKSRFEADLCHLTYKSKLLPQKQKPSATLFWGGGSTVAILSSAFSWDCEAAPSLDLAGGSGYRWIICFAVFEKLHDGASHVFVMSVWLNVAGSPVTLDAVWSTSSDVGGWPTEKRHCYFSSRSRVLCSAKGVGC